MAKRSSSTSRPGPEPGANESSAGQSRPSGTPRRAGLFGFQLRGAVPEQVGDRAWLQAMLDAEAALARAEAWAGAIPAEAVLAIERHCRATEFDVEAIAAAADRTGTPAAALADALSRAVEGAEGAGDGSGRGTPAAAYVHFGATSQDIMDTASMLVARRSLEIVLADLLRAGDRAAGLAEAGRNQRMVGRTLLRPALPTTFGLVAAGWLSGLDRAAASVRRVRSEVLAVQLGGAVGSLASLGELGPAVLGRFAEELGLAEPALPWHTERSRIAEVAAAAGEAAAIAGKIGLDVVLLSQAEIGEAHERGDGLGGSSTMPQKHNPIAAITARTCAARAAPFLATLVASTPAELQRGAGTWQVEWPALSELLALAGSAVAWIAESLERLEPDEARMRANLEAAGDGLLSERVSLALAPALGRKRSRKLVASALERAQAVADGSFAEELAADAAVQSVLSPLQIAELLDSSTYLGSSSSFIDRALAEHRAQRERVEGIPLDRGRSDGPGDERPSPAGTGRTAEETKAATP